MKRFIYPLIAVIVIAVDQFTKYLVRTNMQPGDRIPVIGNWMSIYYVQNTGTAFSMFSGNRFVTVFLTSALIIFCIVFIVKEARAGHTLIPVLFTFVAAGGVSNMIDRLTLGYVTDMISCGIQCCRHRCHMRLCAGDDSSVSPIQGGLDVRFHSYGQSLL